MDLIQNSSGLSIYNTNTRTLLKESMGTIAVLILLIIATSLPLEDSISLMAQKTINYFSRKIIVIRGM